MSQQYPYLPNGQAMQQAQLYPQTNGALPSGYGQPGMMPGQQGLPPNLQGMDPAMLAQMQQAMAANPDEGDGFGILPSPQAAAIGAVGGAGVAVAFNQLEKRNVFFNAATWLDKLPGVRTVSSSLEKQLDKIANPPTNSFWAKKGWLQNSFKEFFLGHAPGAIERMEAEQIKEVMRAFPNRFNKSFLPFSTDYKPIYNSLVNNQNQVIRWQSEQIKKEIAKATKEINQQALESAKKFAKGSPQYQKIMKKAAEDIASKTQALNSQKISQVYNLADKNAKWIQASRFDDVIKNVDTQLKYLKEAGKPSQKPLIKHLRGLKERLSGLHTNYAMQYAEQANLASSLKKQGVGPVGRFFANTMNYLKRIFNGETMQMGAKKASQGFSLGSVLMPAFAGALIFGQSIDKAQKAKEGEKVKTFFHDFLGLGIANFIGWELGRKALNSCKFASRLLGSKATSTLPMIFGRAIPLIGGITLGGFVTEIIAMFVIGSVFQKAGELISHKIFGKPSEESIEGKAQKKQQQQNPMQPNPSQQSPQQRSMEPARREQIQKMLPAAKFHKRPTTSLTPEMISRSRAAEEQARIDRTFLNTPWNPEDNINPYKTEY
jgi:hypothetical protein